MSRHEKYVHCFQNPFWSVLWCLHRDARGRHSSTNRTHLNSDSSCKHSHQQRFELQSVWCCADLLKKLKSIKMFNLRDRIQFHQMHKEYISENGRNKKSKPESQTLSCPWVLDHFIWSSSTHSQLVLFLSLQPVFLIVSAWKVHNVPDRGSSLQTPPSVNCLLPSSAAERNEISLWGGKGVGRWTETWNRSLMHRSSLSSVLVFFLTRCFREVTVCWTRFRAHSPPLFGGDASSRARPHMAAGLHPYQGQTVVIKAGSIILKFLHFRTKKGISNEHTQKKERKKTACCCKKRACGIISRLSLVFNHFTFSLSKHWCFVLFFLFLTHALVFSDFVGVKLVSRLLNDLLPLFLLSKSTFFLFFWANCTFFPHVFQFPESWKSNN